MYGTHPSGPGAYAVELFGREHVQAVLELDAGQGRDGLAFLRAGLDVTAVDYAADAFVELRAAAATSAHAQALRTAAWSPSRR
jgi:hypothetical protein